MFQEVIITHIIMVGLLTLFLIDSEKHYHTYLPCTDFVSDVILPQQ